ncbi:hypothetical protein BU17DRAFT_68032 [Hysterangium stoloniferum]|nr:hypothetical protein BU17DRAFT_68032 [Hysterangium stoloniferum]
MCWREQGWLKRGVEGLVKLCMSHVGMSMKINVKLSQGFPEPKERCKIELKEISHTPSKALFIMGNKRSVSAKRKAGKKTLLTDEGKASPDAGMKTRSYSDTAHKRVTWAHLLSNTDLDDNALQDTPKDAAVDDYRPEVDASDSVDSEDIVMVSADSEKDNDNSTIEEEQKLKRRAKTKERPPKAAAKAQPILLDNDQSKADLLFHLVPPFLKHCIIYMSLWDAITLLESQIYCINLRTEIDWEGLKQHAHLVHPKDAIINGKLLVDESQGYMASLQKRLADTTTSALHAHTSNRKYRGKTVELPMLNLDTTAGSGGLQLNERSVLQSQQACHACASDFGANSCMGMCDTHDAHGVTLDIPPDTGAFEDFHATRAEHLAKTASVPTLATGPCPMDMTNTTAPFAAMMMGMASGFASMMHAPPVAQAPTVLSTATVANSSNSGGLLNMSFDIDYPEMEVFFQELMEHHPQCCGLDGIAANLVAKDFLCIDEIAGMSESRFEGPLCSLSEGNANFVSKAVKKAVNQAQCDSLI